MRHTLGHRSEPQTHRRLCGCAQGRYAQCMISGGSSVLYVADMKRALRFYIETLGMKLVEERGALEQVIDAGQGFTLTLRFEEVPGAHVRGAPLEFHVRDFSNARTIYENRGIAFRDELLESVHIAHFADPDGNALSLRG